MEPRARVRLRLAEDGPLGYDTDRRDLLRDGDVPHPPSLGVQKRDVDVFLGPRVATVDALEPAVNGELVEALVVLLQPQLVAEHGAAARGVDDDAARDVDLLPGEAYAHARRPLLREEHVDHRGPLVHLRPARLRVLQQTQIEAATIDVVGVSLSNPRLGDFAEGDLELAAALRWMPGGAVLVNEPLALHGPEEPELLEDASGRGDQRFSHVRTGMNGLVEDRDLDPGPGQVCTEAGARRPATHDRNVDAIAHGTRGPRCSSRLASGQNRIVRLPLSSVGDVAARSATTVALVACGGILSDVDRAHARATSLCPRRLARESRWWAPGRPRSGAFSIRPRRVEGEDTDEGRRWE